MDLRVQKTTNSILEAFIELRSQKPIEKITIKELTALAKISKQTFYLHYKDIYDLSDKLEDELIAEIIKNISSPENFLDEIGKSTIEMFQKATSQGQLYKIIFSGSRVNVLVDKLEREIKALVYKKNPKLRTDLKTNVYLSLLIQGCYHAYQEYAAVDQDKVIAILGDVTAQITARYIETD